MSKKSDIKYSNIKLKKYYLSIINIFIYMILKTRSNLVYILLIISYYKTNLLFIY